MLLYLNTSAQLSVVTLAILRNANMIVNVRLKVFIIRHSLFRTVTILVISKYSQITSS